MPPLPFHPLINAWFYETYGKPTAVQEEAWPLIAAGENVLAIAPTGSGKTLTGFLSAISRFAEGTYPDGKLSVLYVSPLKALNEDIKRNLLLPLDGIQKRFEEAGEAFPAIRVETRSGDTPQAERRRFLSLPPSILALTPESLGIILLNPRGRQALSTARCVIMDEIHAALGSKRGCYLSCQIDRLSLVAGNFQRIALSATVKPPEAAANLADKKIHIVAPTEKKEIQFKVIFPESEGKPYSGESGVERYGKRYTELIKFVLGRIRANEKKATILVFTDSRRRAERISFLLNQTAEKDGYFAGRPVSYCHHGSLSKEVRREVETALASGEISCVVATGSLELGIDIGNVDEVILAGSPISTAVALQRVGRSGHAVGVTSRGWLFPFHGIDLLQAAALSGAVEERELEETESIENPLDLLAQIILSFCAEEDQNEDELFRTIRGFYVYRNLSRESFDGVVRMLSGSYEDTRLRELKRRLFRDDATKTLSAAPGLLPLLYTSGGVITSRGQYSLRLAPGTEGAGTKIGELDEEFVWERRLGDTFDFGNRSWRITAIGSEAVEVIPLSTGADSVPFWHGEAVYRSPVLSQRILEILEGYYPKGWTSLKAERMLDSFSDEAKKALEDFLLSQWSQQKGIPMPGPSFIPIEIIDDPDRGDAYLIIFHSFRGGAINFPLSLALASDLEARFNIRVDGAGNDNAVFVKLPRSIDEDPAVIIQESLRRVAESGTGEERFKERLESSGIFGAAFRESSERSLVLPRSPFGKRMPLWITRQKSKTLFDAVRRYRDFPVTAEAWRTCLNDQFDMKGFAAVLEDIGSGALSVDFFTTRQASPFSKELTWIETNSLMYEYDERPDLASSGPSLSDKVIAEALGSAASRPPLKADLVEDFCSRLKREIAGWAPDDELTLREWVKERIAIPADEWERLLRRVPAELLDAIHNDKSLGGKLEYIGQENAVVVHQEWAEKWKDSDRKRLAEDCLGQWLRYQGPVPLSKIAGVFGLSITEAKEVILLFSDSERETLVSDVTVEDVGKDLVCDRENLELLLRLSRRKRRPEIKEKPATLLVPFLARRQGLIRGASDSGRPWERLAGITAQAKLWEAEFFPCRFSSYSSELFDREIREGRLLWYGAEKEKAAFCRPEDLDLVLPPALNNEKSAAPFSGRLPPDFFDTPRSFWEIKDALIQRQKTAGTAPETNINSTIEELWEEVWRGNLSADSWEPMRRAIESGFSPAEYSKLSAERQASCGNSGKECGAFRVPRAIRERWKSGTPVRGLWFSLASDFPLDDDQVNKAGLLEEEELNRERARLLLDRWGILTRPLLEREAPALSWARLLPTIRRMELAGELVTGRFFGGVASLQFASPRIVSELEEAEAERGIYWMNAADPASPAGLAVESVIRGAERDAPAIRRTASSRLCFRGAELLAFSNRSCQELEIFIPPDDSDIVEALEFVKVSKTRKAHKENKIIVEKINGASASSSAYSEVLSTLGFVKDRGRMVLW
jgi:ATP-dependent helicase Lhr and Lhr-like helicase